MKAHHNNFLVLLAALVLSSCAPSAIEVDKASLLIEPEIFIADMQDHIALTAQTGPAPVEIYNIPSSIKRNEINKEDIQFLITRYFPRMPLSLNESKKYAYYSGKTAILKHFHYNDWSKKYYAYCIEQIKEIIQRDISPNFIGRELIKFLKRT